MKKRLTMFLACLFLVIGTALAQTKVTGTVISQEDGQPIIGAAVKIDGTSQGMLTDVNGKFSLTLPKGKNQITVSYLGMESKTVTARNGMRVVLKADTKVVDEVVVTGYGIYKKSTFTGAASTVSTLKLENVPTTSLEDKLAGGVPGVSIGTSSGAPGAVNSIRVRGMGSINAGNEPLYVIDGTPMMSSNLNSFSDPVDGGYNDAGTSILATINSNDIESITVIKDAAAASLYGSRAANGVIVITTKSGKKGKTQVNYQSDWGFSNMAVNYRPQLSGEDRRTLLTLGLKNYALYENGATEAEANAYAEENIGNYAAKPKTGWTNWKDELFRTGKHQNYQVSLNGGNDNTQFYASLSYLNQEGIIYDQDMERFTGNASLSHKFGRFTFKLNTMFSKMNQNLCNEGTSYDGAVANYAFFQNPSSSPYELNDDGTTSVASGCGIFGVNPVYERDHSSDKSVINRAFNTLSLTWNIWDNLNLMEKVAYDYTSDTEDVLWDRLSNNGAPGAVMQRIINNYAKLNTQTQLSYLKEFGEHTIDVLAGFETEDYDYRQNYMRGQDYPTDLYEFANAGETSSESNIYQYRMTSFLGRLNYNYADKYYFGASFRRDGSSRLSKDNRWGNFWSVSGAWRFTKEGFAKSFNKVLTDGKIRVSYGVNGTQPSDYYAYKNYYKYGIKYNGTAGMAIVGIGNPDLKWEKNESFNIGLDLTFLERFSLTFDYYTRTTKDLIYDLLVSYVPGYYDGSTYDATAAQNVGSLKNSGFELTLSSVNIRKKDFEWTTSINFGHNSNKVKKLDGLQNEIISGPLIHRVGETYYSYYLYEYAGVDPETGKELYYINGDNPATARNTTTEVSEANKTIVGKHEPTIEGGLTNNIVWKFIDFGFTLTYSLGGDAFDRATWQHSNGGTYVYYGATPAYYDISKMWTGPGDTSATLPKFQYGSTAQLSSRWLMPTDYLRVKNLTIGFSAPKAFLSKYGVSKARLYFSASNLLTWKSKDLFVDPEMPVSGCCTFETPALRTFTFGVELGF